MMYIKKLGLILFTVLLCLSATACDDQREPNPDELQTPQYSAEEPPDFAPPPDGEIHSADQGVKVIVPDAAEPAADIVDSEAPSTAAGAPDTVWENDAIVTYNAFTLPEKAALDDGSIGSLAIPKINLTVPVYESDDQMEDMEQGVAHFKSTSAWDGNVGLSGHNNTTSGYGAYFKDLHQLVDGDSITYKTALGERQYKVISTTIVDDEDWSWLSRTADNRLTLITCVNNSASQRLMVQAVQT